MNSSIKKYCLLGLVPMMVSHSPYAFGEEKAVYRLKWLFNVSTVGDLYADYFGYFKAKGLEVGIKEGGPERDAIREIELGHAQFGVASGDQIIRALSKGAPVVVLAQLFQVNPLQWIYRKSKPPIRSVSDLKGRTIGVTYGGNDEIIMRTLLAKYHIPERDVRFFSVRYDFTPFYQDRADIWPVYVNAQGPILIRKLRENKEDTLFLNPADFDVRFTANSIITSAKLLEKEPELVDRFMGVLLNAWEDALSPENTQRSLEVLAHFDKETPADILSAQLEMTRKQIKPSPSVKIGRIDREAWKQTEEIMLTQKQISSPVFVEKALVIK